MTKSFPQNQAPCLSPGKFLRSLLYSLRRAGCHPMSTLHLGHREAVRGYSCHTKRAQCPLHLSSLQLVAGEGLGGGFQVGRTVVEWLFQPDLGSKISSE